MLQTLTNGSWFLVMDFVLLGRCILSCSVTASIKCAWDKINTRRKQKEFISLTTKCKRCRIFRYNLQRALGWQTKKECGVQRNLASALEDLSRQKVEIFFHLNHMDNRKNIAVFESCQTSPTCTSDKREELRWEWIWSISEMILTGRNWSIRRKTCPNATLSITNLTWIGLESKPGLRSDRDAIIVRNSYNLCTKFCSRLMVDNLHLQLMPVGKYSLTVRIVWAKYSFLNVTVYNTYKPQLGFNSGVSKLFDKRPKPIVCAVSQATRVKNHKRNTYLPTSSCNFLVT